jgi:TonB family protein
MSENILVVEYEPRYTDRVRQALAGQPFVPSFAKDGEEAMRALEEQRQPRLIVLSSIVPKISTTELIRAIRGRNALSAIPILLTVSGYNGKSPKQDAERVGASDILPKPYSEMEFLGKVHQMLGIRAPAPPPVPAGQQLTSNEIFGDLLDDAAATPGVTKSMSKQKDDLDKLLADTLGGVMPQKRTKDQPAPQQPPATPTPPAAAAKPATGEVPRPKTQGGTSEYDRKLSDTLSGLEKSGRKQTTPGAAPVPPVSAPPPAATPPPRPVTPPPAAAAPAPAPAAPRFNTEKLQAYVPDRVPVSQPVFPAAPPAAAAAPVHEEEPTDGTKFGQYVLLERIATGGMAEVWKARMRGVEGFQKIVAIKKILPHLSDNQDFIEMFVDEAKLAAQLNHNNIIHIYDLGKIATSYYIAMEYVDGHDLKTILKRAQERDQPMGVEVALLVAAKLAAALDYAHRKRDFEDKEMGLVHRDVSPQNVLISEEGDIKLCDFGIAKAASKASHTQAGALKGKLQYMSPEQAWGRNIDKRSDIFALATVLFEMLAGRKLFTGDNEISILEQVREARITRVSEINDEVTPEVDAIVIKALQKDPAQRYQTAGEMERDLNQVLYSFRPTPTSADLAIYMHRLWSPDAVMHHEPETIVEHKPAPVPVAPVVTPAAAAVAAAPIAHPAAHTPEPWDQPRSAKKGAPIVPIVIAAVVILAAVGGYLALRGKNDAAPAVTASAAPSAAAPGATGTLVPVPAAGDTAGALAATGTTATSTSLDPNLVNQEVQKRIAAERSRLEAATRAQNAAATATTAPARPVPQPVAAAPAPVTPAPVPVPQPVAPAPQPVVAETRPAPQPVDPEPAPAAPARVKEGDLVPAGTPGLVTPRVVKLGNVPYPPLAKMQRVGGTVLMNVLVSETGEALEVRLLRGVSQRVGLNEAAAQMMRRTTFTPATKDGVKVRAWATVPVDFKP